MRRPVEIVNLLTCRQPKTVAWSHFSRCGMYEWLNTRKSGPWERGVCKLALIIIALWLIIIFNQSDANPSITASQLRMVVGSRSHMELRPQDDHYIDGCWSQGCSSLPKQESVSPFAVMTPPGPTDIHAPWLSASSGTQIPLLRLLLGPAGSKDWTKLLLTLSELVNATSFVSFLKSGGKEMTKTTFPHSFACVPILSSTLCFPFAHSMV